GLGPALERHGDAWSRAVAAHPDRAALLDGLTGRLLRGGRPVDLRWFLRLHRTLAPDPGESGPRLRDYVRMLPATPTAVADLAFDQLRLADAVEPLPPALFAEAAESLLFRPEKRLVKATLTWLARTSGGRTGATLTAVGNALDHPDPVVRAQAGKIVAPLSGERAAPRAVTAEPRLPVIAPPVLP
ncbi:hypothetical protein, partial [Actinocorallia lasiicapitis]